MDAFAIVGCVTSLLFIIIIGWQLYNRKRKPRFNNRLVIAETLQPQIVCCSVPCQHPYYRVISECTEYKIPQEKAFVKEKVDITESPRKFKYDEWSRSLSLSSMPRKTGHSSSRRSSASDVGRSFLPVTK
ncbi:hypothetical protein X975_19103, partial [Stegodyphus mimosarum]